MLYVVFTHRLLVTDVSAIMCVDVSYHGERHAVNLVFVFGLVLSEGTVPEQERGERDRQMLIL